MLILSRARAQQPTRDVPRINWLNQITNGLVFCAVPVGATYLELVTGVLGDGVVVPVRGVRTRNGGLSTDTVSQVIETEGSAGSRVSWPTSSRRGGTLVQTGTLLALGGSTQQVDGELYPLIANTENVSLGDGFSLLIDSFTDIGRGNIIKANYTPTSFGTSATELLGSTFGQRTHLFGYTFNANGVNGKWLAGGKTVSFSGKTAHGTTTTDRRAHMLATGTTGSSGTKRSFAALGLMWDREISAAEYAALYFNSWLFLENERPINRTWVAYPGSVLKAPGQGAIQITGLAPSVTGGPTAAIGSLGQFDPDLRVDAWF